MQGCLQKSCQLYCGFVLRGWLELFERAGECIRQAPMALLMNGLKVQLVHSSRQMLGE